jgi:DNA-binding phage protein
MTESAERLLLWVENHGGASQVSKKAGLDRQVFHSLKTKDIEPSLPTLKKVHSVYPTLDIHWISTGEKRE